MSDPVPQTDVSRPSALPTADLLNRQRRAAAAAIAHDSDAYLDAIEEEWNKKVDVDVETLVDGMVDLVGLASIGNKDKFKIAQESFQAQARAESMVRAANSLLSTTHSIKLLLLLSDEAQLAHRRDTELAVVRGEVSEAKAEVAKLLDELFHPGELRRRASDTEEENKDSNTPAAPPDEGGPGEKDAMEGVSSSAEKVDDQGKETT